MRVFVTGGAGFIGRRVVALLADRGDEVVAPVRDPARATDPGLERVTLLRSDLGDAAQLAETMTGCDGVIHSAGMYRIGIRAGDRDAMWAANVDTTERVLEAAIAAGVSRIVYVSTVNVFGDTRGQIVDETFRRDLRHGFVSWYDRTKHDAHAVAEARSAGGAPIVIVLPGGVYGPGDHSEAGRQLEHAYRGSLRYRALDDVGLCWAHVDDVAAGIVGALDRGRIGESYVLAGPAHRMRSAVATAARLAGRQPPRLRVPTRLLRGAAPVAARLPAGLVARAGLPPNLAEVVTASDGVTYWASSAKAARELDFRTRDLETGLRNTFGHR
jgi:nucleoside-diphosphate-sugar epimerase